MIDSFSISAKQLKEVAGYFKTGDFLPIFPAVLGGLWEGGVSKALGAYIWSDFKVDQNRKLGKIWLLLKKEQKRQKGTKKINSLFSEEISKKEIN